MYHTQDPNLKTKEKVRTQEPGQRLISPDATLVCSDNTRLQGGRRRWWDRKGKTGEEVSAYFYLFAATVTATTTITINLILKPIQSIHTN